MSHPRTIASLVAISIFFSVEYWLGANWYISLPLGIVGYLLIRYVGWALNERRRFKQEFDQVLGENAREPMAKVLFFSDPSNGRPGLGATIRLDSGEPCIISIAPPGWVRVKKIAWVFSVRFYSQKRSLPFQEYSGYSE
jgi:hypothetical protein